MAMIKILRVMVSGYTSFLVLSSLACLVSASICPEKQYLNSKLQQCMNCTECKDGTFVLRPCEFHRDTHCIPISELLKTMDTGNPHRHKHNSKEHRRGHGDDIEWRYGSDVGKTEEAKERRAAAVVDVASSEAPFSSAETLVWDWQALALTSAVFVCILFFLVITLYSLHQARQWRRLKENFEADVEELSAKLSLMAEASCEKGEFLDSAVIGPMSESYLNNRCVYLEQLLSVRKDGNKTGTLPKGNVYIEETNSKT